MNERASERAAVESQLKAALEADPAFPSLGRVRIQVIWGNEALTPQRVTVRLSDNEGRERGGGTAAPPKS